MAKSKAETTRDKAMKKAREIREGYRLTGLAGQEFTKKKFQDDTRAECIHLAKDALDGLVLGVCEEVDRQASHVVDAEQLLLPGFDDLAGDYNLGDGRRVPKALALWDQFLEAFKLSKTNAKRVIDAHAAREEEMVRLKPYWLPGLTKAEAVAAYRLDYPLPKAEGAA